jgi:uncharacterized protein YrrD
MEFQSGAKVINPRGEIVGSVDRVVLDPRTKEITHIVVRKGFLTPTDKVLPVRYVSRTEGDRVLLQPDLTQADIDELPEFEETEYLLADEQDYVKRPQAGAPAPGPIVSATTSPALLWYPSSPTAASAYGGIGNTPFVPAGGPDYLTQTKRNIPENTVGLKEGAKVNSADGHHVGNVERVFADENTNRATHVLVGTGVLFKKHTPIPVTWIDTVTDDEITLAVSEKLLKGLPEYKGE